MRRVTILTAVAFTMALAFALPAKGQAEQLHYYGGEAITKPHVYLTFWGSKWNENSGARSEVEEMFKHLSGSGWQGILTQYFGNAGYISSEVAFTSWTDEAVSAPTNVTEPSMESEIQRAEAVRGWPAGGINNFYLVLPSPGSTYVSPICAAHRYSGTLNAPWGYVTGYKAKEGLNCLASDPTGQERLGPTLSSDASHEYSEAVTDPVTVAFAGRRTGWMLASSGAAGEIADVCGGWATLPNGSYVQKLWDNYSKSCSASDPNPLRATQTELVATSLNGNPGWLTVKGNVLAGNVINNGQVLVKLYKWNTSTSKWDPKNTLEATVNNNAFEINNWYGVGVGSWLAEAEFPSQSGFAGSTSNASEGGFIVKDGYRIVNKNSGKCLDVLEGSKENGARLQQWECLDPKSIQNQVYTLRPGNGSYELIARHSGRCVDVVNADTANGAGLQQWTCNGFAQQKWTGVAAGEYINFVAKHSGKCMDVTGAGTGNGTLIQQWDCNGSAQQKWYLQSVDSAPTPTETFLTVPPEERLNGQYGFASAHGYVKTGAYPIGGNYVNVKYEKEVSPGNFEFVKANHPTLNNEGFYESKYEGLGSGNWRIWTEFPGAGNLAASRSATVNFHLGTGYRFVFRHSGKCLNLYGNSAALGTKLVQWDCFANPNPSDGEVFTLVPFHNGNDFEILINSVSTPESGRCVDVTGAGTGNGVKLQSYLCYNGAYSNQLWHWIPISGQEPWQAFISVSSGKCMGVEGDYTYNGANVWQWECLWVPNQQWKFQGVG
jgi:hypothetical protein